MESSPPRLRRQEQGHGFLLEKGEEWWAGRPSDVTSPVGQAGVGSAFCICVKPPGDPDVD